MLHMSFQENRCLTRLVRYIDLLFVLHGIAKHACIKVYCDTVHDPSKEGMELCTRLLASVVHTMKYYDFRRKRRA